MKKAFLVYIMLLTTLTMMGQQPHDLNAPGRQEIQIVSDSTGCRLMVDGKPFFLKGMNWDYFPIGTNYAYSLWKQPDDVIQAALDKEMLLLSEMGETLTAEEKAEMGEHIRKGTETLTELLTEVLQFTRLESGRVQAMSEKVDVAQLVREAVVQHQDVVAEGVQLVVAEGRPDVFITADNLRMQEILHQYISNAARYTTQGFIRVGWDYRPEADEVLIHVEDTGCGIAEEKQPQVFSLFWKEDEFTSGIGIGLTLVKRYTELMGGKLHFTSRYGEGCDFGVVFPAYLDCK